MSDGNTILYRRTVHGDGLEEGSSSDANDIWDDTLLIKTYEKAEKLAMQSLGKESLPNEKSRKSKKKEKNINKWKIGDHCCCPYSQDGNLYEADIIDLDLSTGTCTVKYVGYNNIENVLIKLLQTSQGESYRSQQILDAANDNDEEWKTFQGYPQDAGGITENKLTKKKKTYSKMKSHVMENGSPFTNISAGRPLNSLIPPPPPPPHLFKNICEDSEETEAMSAMLIAWYMSGYHTGYYQGLKMAKKNCSS